MKLLFATLLFSLSVQAHSDLTKDSQCLSEALQFVNGPVKIQKQTELSQFSNQGTYLLMTQVRDYFSDPRSQCEPFSLKNTMALMRDCPKMTFECAAQSIFWSRR